MGLYCIVILNLNIDQILGVSDLLFHPVQLLLDEYNELQHYDKISVGKSQKFHKTANFKFAFALEHRQFCQRMRIENDLLPTPFSALEFRSSSSVSFWLPIASSHYKIKTSQLNKVRMYVRTRRAL